MKKILLINGSPRKTGTSFLLGKMCSEYLLNKSYECQLLHLYSSLNNIDKPYESINNADTIIISGPCYINTYPADMIDFLEKVSRNKEILHGQSIYGIIQGGMPYAHTHESGLKMLEIFGKKCGLNFKGGFVMGMGALVNGGPLNKLPNSKKFIKQLNVFFEHISRDEISLSEVYKEAQFKMPSLVYKIMSVTMNRKIDSNLKKHGIDVNQENPYLT
ncbi:NAD(P)H-dependent oxidoreductase [Clostridium intestinale]|uniref:NAD(P)H-dependent oxidoreductase n=1 Tax=Clostridium intestinale TaxID=36845 RepID=UPI002DD67965|nr:NAD(P)H-dependent oxidoreductase [Clostridium intestinale]WRY52683.1 NAD(P)H-dependent oxidoreductase [Clostridium intestinale]